MKMSRNVLFLCCWAWPSPRKMCCFVVVGPGPGFCFVLLVGLAQETALFCLFWGFAQDDVLQSFSNALQPEGVTKTICWRKHRSFAHPHKQVQATLHSSKSLCPRSQSLRTCRLGSVCWHLKRMWPRVLDDGVWDVVCLGCWFVGCAFG